MSPFSNPTIVPSAITTGSAVGSAPNPLVVVPENPLRNFKVLYGTGHFRLNADNEPDRVGGVRYTIKDGIVFDAPELLADVRRIVQEARAAGDTDRLPESAP